jgi:hypothetical protein
VEATALEINLGPAEPADLATAEPTLGGGAEHRADPDLRGPGHEQVHELGLGEDLPGVAVLAGVVRRKR